MRRIEATPKQQQVLDALCEFGQTDLVAYKLGLKTRSVEMVIFRVMHANGYPNRLTLALAWDRQTRKEKQ